MLYMLRCDTRYIVVFAVDKRCRSFSLARGGRVSLLHQTTPLVSFSNKQ